MTDSANKFWIPIFLCIVLGNIAAYWIKSILKHNGYSTNYFTGHFKDTKNIFKLYRQTNSKSLKIKYFTLGFFEIVNGVVLFVFLVLFILNLPSANKTACIAFKEFREKEYDFVVINKYIDSTQHSYCTLITKDKLGIESKNHDLDFDESGLFSYLHLGDTVKKKKRSCEVEIIRQMKDSIFKVNFGCIEK